MIPFKKFAFWATAALAASAVSLAQAQLNIKPSANGEVILVVDFEVKPGMEDEFQRAFKRSVLCSRLEPGNVAFNIHKVHDTERRYVLYEIWRNTEALNIHFETPYTKALFATFDRTLVRPVTEGGLHFLAEIDPAKRTPPAKTNPTSRAECR